MEDLFDLIHSLSPHEKRHFKIYVQRHNKTQIYLQIYEAINKMNTHDEGALRIKVPRASPGNRKHLYRVILEAMRDYRNSKKIIQIKNNIIDARFFFERRLYSQSKKRLEDAKKVAHEMDDQISLLEINKEERNLLRVNKEEHDLIDLELLIDTKKKILENVDLELAGSDIFDELYVKFVLPVLIDEDVLKQTYFSRLNQLTVKISSPIALHNLYKAKSLYYELLGDYDKVYLYCKQAITWWDDNEVLKNDTLHSYIKDILNLIHGCLQAKKYQEIPQVFARLDQIESKTPHEEQLIFLSKHMYKLPYQFLTPDFMNTSDVPLIKKGLKKYQNSNISNRITLINNVSTLFFIREDFELCSEWCQMLQDETKTNNHRYLIQSASRLRHLVCLLELDTHTNGDTFKNLARSIKRSIEKHAEFHANDFEMRILGFLKIIFNEDLSGKKVKYQELLDYLNEFEKTNSGKNISNFRKEIWFWAKSKLERKPIYKIYEREILKNGGLHL